MKNRPKVGIGVVVIRRNTLLLGKRKNAHGSGEWSFAGGHLEFGEDVEECAKRELEEETGLKATQMQLGPWTNDVIDNDKHYLTLFTAVTQFEGEPQLLEPNKCEEWKWFPYNALPSPLFKPICSLLSGVGIDWFESLTSDQALLAQAEE